MQSGAGDQGGIIKLNHFALVAIILLMLVFGRVVLDPATPILLPAASSDWVMRPQPVFLGIYETKPRRTAFARQFRFVSGSPLPVVELEALGAHRAFLNGVPIGSAQGDPGAGRSKQKLKLSGIRPGLNDLVIEVTNSRGPPALLTRSELRKLNSNQDWSQLDADVPNSGWESVALARASQSAAIAARSPKPLEALAGHWVSGICIVLMVAAGFYWVRLQGRVLSDRAACRLIALSFLPILHSSVHIDPLIGFDARAHMDYVRYVFEEQRIPLASDGWQMFQAPLYYLLTALVIWPLSRFMDPGGILPLLKVVPVLSAMALSLVSYRVASLLLPATLFIRTCALIFCAALPLNLYMGQYFGNEPTAAALTGVSTLLLCHWLKTPETSGSVGAQGLLGLLIGLALLSKVSAVLFLPTALILFYWIRHRAGASVARIVLDAARIGLVILAVAGWYYLRNWIELGRPFVGGWDPGRGISWWQYPGFRNLSDLLSFGQALYQPVYAATLGFWNGFYASFWSDSLLGSRIVWEFRPPWQYSLMAGSNLLALLPTLGLGVGLCSAVGAGDHTLRTGLRFAAATIAIYLFTMIYLFLQLPAYGTIKASYTLGLMPCYALLCIQGLRCLARNPLLESTVVGVLAWWGTFSYLSYLSVF